MNDVFGRDTCYVTTIGLSQIAGAQFLHVYQPRNWINCGQAGPLGWTLPAALGVRAADPEREIVALSGDYDFQFLIEELAFGAEYKLPYLHVPGGGARCGLYLGAQPRAKTSMTSMRPPQHGHGCGSARVSPASVAVSTVCDAVAGGGT